MKRNLKTFMMAAMLCIAGAGLTSCEKIWGILDNPITPSEKTVDVTLVKLSQTKLNLVAGGETATLTATVNPDNATDKTVTWTSDNEAVATVKDGVVTPVAEGKATITAKAGNKTATCTVTVASATIEVTDITLDKTTLTLAISATATLKATVTPDDATDKTVTWETSDEKIATVADGVVTAVAAGTATITAKTGDKTATCAVTVEAPYIAEETPLTFEAEDADGKITLNLVNYTYQEKAIEYSIDGGTTWTSATVAKGDVTKSPTDPGIVTTPAAHTIMLRGNNDAYSATVTKGAYILGVSMKIFSDKDCYLYGNIMSLVKSTGFDKETTLAKDSTFTYLFDHADHNPYPYVTEYGAGLYKNHPTKKLVLPATTLSTLCYSGTFNGCEGLTVAPVLPAQTLTDRCYYGMFANCTSLTEVTCLATDWSADLCIYDMLSGVTSSGTFYYQSGTDWSSSTLNLPSGWTMKEYSGE